MTRIGRTALAALAALTTVQVAKAQLPGIPYYPVNTGLGINVAADYGKPTGSGATGHSWGVTGGLGLSNLGLSASFGGADAGAGSQTTLGGALGMKLFGGGLTPVQIGAQVGVGHVGAPAGGSAITTFEPAAWVKVSPPLFPLKPFGQVYYVTGTCGTGCSFNNETRVSIGANFNLLLGLGVHAAYDFSTKSGGAKGWGVGAHMNFRVPSLGVPGVPGI